MRGKIMQQYPGYNTEVRNIWLPPPVYGMNPLFLNALYIPYNLQFISLPLTICWIDTTSSINWKSVLNEVIKFIDFPLGIWHWMIASMETWVKEMFCFTGTSSALTSWPPPAPATVSEVHTQWQILMWSSETKLTIEQVFNLLWGNLTLEASNPGWVFHTPPHWPEQCLAFGVPHSTRVKSPTLREKTVQNGCS